MSMLPRDAASEPAVDWQLRLAWWNDVFAELPPADDSGFTNDFELDLRVTRSFGELGVRVFHRIITEQFGSGFFPTRRWDQLDVFATLRQVRTWRGLILSAESRAGPTFAGNLGGLAVQDGWHRLSGTGASTDEGLQDDYDGSRRAGFVAGSRLAATRRVRFFQAGAGVDGQLALGQTGIRAASAFANARLELGGRATRFVLAGEIALARLGNERPKSRARRRLRNRRDRGSRNAQLRRQSAALRRWLGLSRERIRLRRVDRPFLVQARALTSRARGDFSRRRRRRSRPALDVIARVSHSRGSPWARRRDRRGSRSPTPRQARNHRGSRRARGFARY